MDNIKIVIPARRNSKGLPFKNRKLFDFTISRIPTNLLKNNTIITTDDEVLLTRSLHIISDYNHIVNRSPNLSEDNTSTKEVIIDLVNRGLFNESDIVIMLYLTYPERTWDDILSAYNFFIQNSANSLLCKKEVKGTHPYLFMLESQNNKGTQLVKHDLYRRQDYPNVFEISHYICIFRIKELMNLNNNMYNTNTVFYPITDVVDVDTIEDLNKL